MTARAIAAIVAFVVLSLASAAPAPAAEAPLRSDGIHTQPWIKQLSFMVLKEDLDEAKAAGKKGLVVIFEQVGCGSCQRLHEENFADQSLVDFITANFDVMQVNMYGDNLLTDFDGEELSEREFSEKLLINFTPTTVFYGVDGTETFRVPGLLAPNFYRSAFEYVVDDGPTKGVLFPRWLREKRDRQKAADKPS